MKLHLTLVALIISGSTSLAQESSYNPDLTSPYPAIIDPNPPVPYQDQVEFILAKLEQYFPGDEMMVCIAKKESTNLIHWLPSGELIPVSIDENEDGIRDSSAVGVLQALAYLHREEIARLGLDLTDVDDYFLFNRHLRRTQGYGAWKGPWNECKSEGVRGTSLMARN